MLEDLMDENISDHPLTLSFPNIELARQLFGEHNVHLQRIAED